MADTKRYLISARSGPVTEWGGSERGHSSGRPAVSVKASVLDAVIPPGRVIRTLSRGHQVVALTDTERRALGQRPELLIEEDHPLIKYRMPGLPPVVEAVEGPHLFVTVQNHRGDPVQDATLYALSGGVATKAETGPQGSAQITVLERVVAQLIVVARDTYWSQVVGPFDIRFSGQITVKLTPMNLTGHHSWGHRAMGFNQIAGRGQGVRVAVVDSGIAPVADLRIRGGLDTLDDQQPSQWNVDDEGHGTHCAGIVAARGSRSGVLGGAPDAEVFSLKVLPGGYTSDLIEAVTWATERHIEVLSMSLGSTFPSFGLEQELNRAYQAGVTCLAAAGNETTRVAFPAAFPACIAVGAIGCLGTFPPDSAHRLKVGQWFDPSGWYFAANFTNAGPEIRYCAPGVAIPSTVPSGYASWDGTSAGCPMVAALVALVLESYPEIRTGDARQVEAVRSILDYSALSLGLPREYQGVGLPSASRALALNTGLGPLGHPASRGKNLSGRQSPWR